MILLEEWVGFAYMNPKMGKIFRNSGRKV